MTTTIEQPVRAATGEESRDSVEKWLLAQIPALRSSDLLLLRQLVQRMQQRAPMTGREFVEATRTYTLSEESAGEISAAISETFSAEVPYPEVRLDG